MTIYELSNRVFDTPARSAWAKGVKAYALDLLESVADGIDAGWIDSDIADSPKLLRKALLNGAADWSQYSWGGCAYIYDGQIACQLCTPSEFRRVDYGRKDPNPRERWLDVQARALYQAEQLIIGTLEQEEPESPAERAWRKGDAYKMDGRFYSVETGEELK